jgi:hypothetical protein
MARMARATPAFRKRFWTEVLRSLELSLDLLFEEARAFNNQARELMEREPDNSHLREEYRGDLEERIQRLRLLYGSA